MNSTQHRRTIRPLFTPIQPARAISVAQTCPFCKGRIVVRPHGTDYCCTEAELAAYKGLLEQLDRHLESELKDEALDTPVRLSFGHMHRLIAQAESLDES